MKPIGSEIHVAETIETEAELIEVFPTLNKSLSGSTITNVEKRGFYDYIET